MTTKARKRQVRKPTQKKASARTKKAKALSETPKDATVIAAAIKYYPTNPRLYMQDPHPVIPPADPLQSKIINITSQADGGMYWLVSLSDFNGHPLGLCNVHMDPSGVLTVTG